MQVKATIGGKELTFSALSLGQLRALEAKVKEVEHGKLDGFATVLAFVPFIFSSVKQVHTDMTQEKLEELMTVPDLQPAQVAMMQASGLTVTVTKPGEDQPAAA